MKKLAAVVVAVVALAFGVLAAGSLMAPARAPLTPAEARETKLLIGYVADAYEGIAATDSTDAAWYWHVWRRDGALQIEVRGTTAYVYTDLRPTGASGPVTGLACMAVAAVAGDANTGQRLSVTRVVIIGEDGREEITSCDAPALSIPQPPRLHVRNGTTVDVHLYVNGEYVAVFAAGQALTAVDPWSLPALPWTVETRLPPTYRALAAVTIKTGDDQGSGASPVGRAILSCGSIDIYLNNNAPTASAASPAGSPGDCAP